MKRICPACNNKELYYKPFFSHPYMLCLSCNSVFTHTKLMGFSFLLVCLLIALMPIYLHYLFNLSIYYIAPVVLIISFFIIYFIRQYFPVKSVERSEINLVPPTFVDFEKTDSVSENIRRYKEAQNIAIYKKLKE